MITVFFIPICRPPVPAWDLFAQHQISNCFLLNKSCCQCCQATTLSSSTLIYISGCHFVAKLGLPCKIQHLAGAATGSLRPHRGFVERHWSLPHFKILRREPSAWTSPCTSPLSPPHPQTLQPKQEEAEIPKRTERHISWLMLGDLARLGFGLDKCRSVLIQREQATWSMK